MLRYFRNNNNNNNNKNNKTIEIKAKIQLIIERYKENLVILPS